MTHSKYLAARAWNAAIEAAIEEIGPEPVNLEPGYIDHLKQPAKRKR